MVYRFYLTMDIKSIKDNKDTNFRKMPDNLNFELNELRKKKIIKKIRNRLKMIYKKLKYRGRRAQNFFRIFGTKTAKGGY